MKNWGVKGVTLLEITIALGLSAVVVMYSAQVLELSFKSSRDINYDYEMTEMVSNVQFILAQGDNCNQNFKGEPAVQSGIANIVDELDNVIYTTGVMPSSSGLQVTGFETDRVNDKLKLTINFSKQDGFLGAKNVSRSILFKADFDPSSNVISCSPEAVEDANTFVSQFCTGPGRMVDTKGDSDFSNDECIHYDYDMTTCTAGKIVSGFTLNGTSYEANCVDFEVPVKPGDCPLATPVLVGINPNNTLNCRALTMADVQGLFENGMNPGIGYSNCSDPQFGNLYLGKQAGTDIKIDCL